MKELKPEELSEENELNEEGEKNKEELDAIFKKLDKLFFSRVNITLREKCPYSEFFRSVFSRSIRSISPYSVRMRENTDQKNS